MSNLYDGREQSRAKHDILKRYLEPFSNKILSKWKSIDFIDGFSGPWRNTDTENLSDTSIGISLRTLSDVAEARGHLPQSPLIRCLFNEKDPKAYARLEHYVERSRDAFPLIEIKTFQGEFSQNADAIRRAANNAFQLLFVDPTGYTGFPPSVLKLFGNRSSEIIVNFMRSFMERFVSGDHLDKKTALVGLVGEKRAQYLLDTGACIEDVEEEYLKMLRADLGYSFAGFSPVHNPDKEQIHFNLAFATNHPMGMETMRTAEFKALSDYDRTRFNKKQPPQGDLFGSIGEQLDVRGPYLRTREGHLMRAGDEVLRLLAENPEGLKFDRLSALAQQILYLRRTELKDILVELTSRGKVSTSWKVGRKQKPSDPDIIRSA